MSGVSSVIIKIGAETAQAVSAIRQVDSSLKDTASTGDKFRAGLGRAAIPAAAALTALSAAGISAAKAAAAAQASHEQLDSQLRRSTGATDAQVAANEKWVSGMSDMAAVAGSELRPALAGMVRATDDVTKAHELMKTALDVSAATGKPLATVSAAIQKAYNGQAGSLKRLIPSLSDGAVKSKNWSIVQAELNQEVYGAAAEHGKTAEAAYVRLQLSMKKLQVTIGTALLPAMQAFLPIITAVFSEASQHSQVFIILAGAVAVIAGSILALNAALKVYDSVARAAQIVTGLYNSTMLRSALATTAARIQIIAYAVAQKVARVATIVFTAAQWLLNAALDANPIGIVIVALAALAAGLYLAYRHSATFRGMVQSAFQSARENVLLLLGPMGLIARGFIELYQHSSTFRAVVTGAMHAVLEAINLVVDAISNLIGKISGIHFPSKPSWLPLSVPGVPSSAISPMAYGAPAGGPVVNVTINGAIDPESTAIAIRRVMRRYDRRRGQRPLGGLGDYAQ